MTGRRRPRRLVVTGMFVGAASAALGLAGPDALVPFRDVAGAATEVSVAFVVDFGGSIGPVVRCVHVPSGQNGYAALAAFTQQAGESTPVYNSSGLLCSINGDPTSGCGQAVSGGYIYWSYWHGTSGTWQYANTGATATMQNGDVEGWRFENPGKSNPGDPPPGASPDFASICGAVAAPPTTTATSTPAAPLTNGASSDSSVPQAAPPSVGTHQSTAPGSAGVSTSTTPGGGSPPPSSPAPASKAGATMSPSPGQSGSTPSGSAKPGAGAQSLRASPATAHLGGGGSAAPLLLGGGVLAVLIIASILRWRRSTDPK